MRFERKLEYETEGSRQRTSLVLSGETELQGTVLFVNKYKRFIQRYFDILLKNKYVSKYRVIPISGASAH